MYIYRHIYTYIYIYIYIYIYNIYTYIYTWVIHLFHNLRIRPDFFPSVSEAKVVASLKNCGRAPARRSPLEEPWAGQMIELKHQNGLIYG
jgi:hypothetical protein